MSFAIDTYASFGNTMRREGGFTMIEVLVTLVVIALGLIGVMGLQARGQQAELESYQRGQALVLLQDMVDRMNANRTDMHNPSSTTYAASDGTLTSVGGGTSITDCTGKTGAAYDLCDWGNELNGAAEQNSSSALVGTMKDARGCIRYNSATELTDSGGNVMTGTGVYTITVAWQGIAATYSPPSGLDCGLNDYPTAAAPDDRYRRIVTATIRMANLNSP